MLHRFLRDERGGVGMLFAGVVLLWFLYLAMGYGLYVSQAISARAKLLEATLAAAKAGAAEVDAELAQRRGETRLDRRRVEEAAREIFAANNPDPDGRKNFVKEWQLVDVRVAPREDAVEVASRAKFALRTLFGPRDQVVHAACRAKARGFRG